MAEPRRVAVVGAGVFGASTALELAKRGWRVSLIEPCPTPAERAASTDVSKLVRMDYGADVWYHELAEAALDGWDRWNHDWRRPLYHQDGLLVLATRPMAPGGFEHDSLETLRTRGYEPEELRGSAITQRFPRWSVPDGASGYFNPRAGWAESGAVIERLAAGAVEAGAEHRSAQVASLLTQRDAICGVVLHDGTELRADRVVVCAGAWTPKLVPWLSDRLWATAQPVLHFGVTDVERFGPPHFPPWTIDIAETGWYGFPALPDGRLKVGNHGPGRRSDPDAPGQVDDAHVERARAFLREAIPELATAPLLGSRVCLYCDSFDGDFLIGNDPDRPGLTVASGGSGHAFKFAPVLGRLAADVVEGRQNRWSDRFGWRTAGPSPRAEQARARIE